MVGKFKVIALAGAFLIAATPSFADDVTTPVTELVTTVRGDFSKGIAEFNPVEILTPKPIEAPAAAPVKKKRVARKRMKRKMAKK